MRMQLRVYMLLPLLAIVGGDVSHLSKNYLPPEQQTDEEAHDEIATSYDGFYPISGVPLPLGYTVPASPNAPKPPDQAPNFPLPIFPPYFGFGASNPAPSQLEMQETSSEEFNTAPQLKGARVYAHSSLHSKSYSAKSKALDYANGPAFLTKQGLPAMGSALPFHQNHIPNQGFNIPSGFAAMAEQQPDEHLVSVGQPYMPDLTATLYKDEPPTVVTAPPAYAPSPPELSQPAAPASMSDGTVYAANGGYVYERSK